MSWYWYVERDDEITIDLDRPGYRRFSDLQREIDLMGSEVESGWVYPSGSSWHVHIVVQLRHSRATIDRIAWSLLLGNDPRRAARSILRIGSGFPPALLVSPEVWPGFYRTWDEVCPCEGSAHRMSYCPVASIYRPKGEPGELAHHGKSIESYGRIS